MSNALWKGLIGAFSVVLMYLIIYLYKGGRYLIKNPQVLRDWFDRIKGRFQRINSSLGKKLMKNRNQMTDDPTPLKTEERGKKVIVFPHWLKKGLIYTGVLLALSGLVYGSYYLYEEVIQPYCYNRSDEKLINAANQNPSLADSIAIVLAKTNHHCRQWSYDNQHHQRQTRELLFLGARNGDAMAQLHLGKRYESNWRQDDWYDPTTDYYYHSQMKKNTPSKDREDVEHAAYWFEQASKAGNIEAKGRLGVCYALGNGVEYLPLVGERLIHEAADGGNARFQYVYGNLLSRGLSGVYIDSDGNSTYFRDEPMIDLAKQYWRMAAEQGLEEAKLKLERVY